MHFEPVDFSQPTVDTAAAFQLKILLLALFGIPGPLLFSVVILKFPPVTWLSENIGILLLQFTVFCSPLVLAMIWAARKYSFRAVIAISLVGLLIGVYPGWTIYNDMQPIKAIQLNKP